MTATPTAIADIIMVLLTASLLTGVAVAGAVVS